MIEKLIFIFIFFLSSSISWSQIQISGTVVDKSEKIPLPGATVVEKGTRNGTTTDFDGLFSIEVSDENAILEISFIGFITQEVKLKGQKTIEIELQTDCNRDWFDKQHIGFYLNSGVINNPIGGQFIFSLPAVIGEPTLKTEVGYQTNLKENRVFDANIGAHHLFANCDFDADIIASYKNLDFNNEIELSSYSIETNLNFNELTTILGIKTMDFNDANKIGPTLGIGTWIGQPFLVAVSAKTTIFKNLSEYQVEMKKGVYKGIYGFLRYYKIREFNELSLGIGLEITYRTKRQRG